MTASNDKPIPINVVPPFSRLHEGSLWRKGISKTKALSRTCSPMPCTQFPATEATSTAAVLRISPLSKDSRWPTRLASGAPPAIQAPVWVR